MRTAQRSKGKIRVLVADRESIFRLGLKKLFAVEDDLRIVAEAENAAEVLARAETSRPDVAFIQEEILAEGSSNLISAVHSAVSRCKIVATVSSSSDEASTRHFRSGVTGMILKAVDPEHFVKCARRAHNGETWSPKRHVSIKPKLPEAHPDQPLRPADTLTYREKSIISYLMLGWHNREISTHLSISEQTVKNHLRAIYDKVGVSDRLELVLYAIHQHLELPAAQTAVSAY